MIHVAVETCQPSILLSFQMQDSSFTFDFFFRTALHWAAKRNHSSIVSYLLLHGADKYMKTNTGETASQLSSFTDIKNMLGGESTNHATSCKHRRLSPFSLSCYGPVSTSFAGANTETKQTELPINPSYLVNPPFPYTQPVVQQKPVTSSRENLPSHQEPTLAATEGGHKQTAKLDCCDHHFLFCWSSSKMTSFFSSPAQTAKLYYMLMCCFCIFFTFLYSQNN